MIGIGTTCRSIIWPKFIDLQEDLERLFGHHVDLVAKDGLHRVIREQVLSDARVLYTA